MTGHPVRLAVAQALLGAAVLAGCQAGPPQSSPQGSVTTTAMPPCTELAARIVGTVQDYVDSFSDVPTAGIGTAVTVRQADFRSSTLALAERGRVLGCDSVALAAEVRRGLEALHGGTPVQDAVADTFRADPLGSVDPSDAGRVEVRVSTAEELVSAVARVGSGSTITLAAGTYMLKNPLVALRPITLTGAGDGSDPKRMTATTIASTAAGAAVIAATGGNLVLTDLAVEHRGPAAASVVVVAAGGYRFDRVRLSGGMARDGAGGFALILRPSSSPLTPTGDAHDVSGVRIDASTGGGIVIAGAEQPVIDHLTVTGSQGCGICWVESAGGTASDVTVHGGDIGLRVENTASPRVSRANITGANVGLLLNGTGSSWIEDSVVSGGTIGVQSTGSGTLDLVGSRVTGAREIGVRLSGATHTTLDRTTLTGTTRIAMATVGQAASTVTGGEVSSSGEVGLIWGDDAVGTASDLAVRGPKLGVQIGGSATAVISRLVIDRSPTAAVLADGRSAGAISHLTCGRAASSIVLLADSTTVRIDHSPACSEVRR